MDTYEEPGAAFEQIKRSCVDEGLLKPALGAGNLRITKKGQDFVKAAALADHEVLEALDEALHSPWLERREMFVSVVLFARERAVAEHAARGGAGLPK